MRETDSDSTQTITHLQTLYEQAFVLKRIVVSSPGKSTAINSALEVVTSDIICFTDDDAEPHPDWIEKIVQHFEDSTVAGVGGRDIIIQNGKSLEGKCKIVGQMSWFGRYIGNHHLELESGKPMEAAQLCLTGLKMAKHLTRRPCSFPPRRTGMHFYCVRHA